MNQQQALEAAQQIGVKPGETITMQSEGQIMHPHLHSGQLSGQPHVDGWAVTNNGGNLAALKIHSGG
jgi:hypothetical protein